MPVIGVKRKGKIVLADSFESQRAKEFLFVEMYTTDMVGRTKIKFTQPVDMAIVEEESDQLFSFVVQSYRNEDVLHEAIQIRDITWGSVNVTNQTIDVQFKLDRPNEVGLNTEKSDYIIMQLNPSFPWSDLLASSLQRQLQD